MPTFDGQTLSDYTVTHGYSPVTFSVDYDSLSNALLSEVLGEQKTRLNSFAKSVGLVKVKRGGFAPSCTLSTSAIYQHKGVLKLSIDHPTRQNDVAEIVSQYLPLKQWEDEMTQADLLQKADFDMQVGEMAHNAAVKDRERIEETARQADKHVWEAAESVLDRAAQVILQDTEQAHKTSEAVLARSHKDTLQGLQTAWEEALQSLKDGVEWDVLIESIKIQLTGVKDIDFGSNRIETLDNSWFTQKSSVPVTPVLLDGTAIKHKVVRDGNGDISIRFSDGVYDYS